MSKNHILLLHGALGSEAQFQVLKNHLPESFEVHTFSFEGHGGRSSNRPFSMQNFADNVLTYLDENKLESVNIFGYSMGGYVALMFSNSHPSRVNRIITLGTKFNWSPEFSASEVRKLNPDKIEEKVPHFAKVLEKVHAPLDWKQVVSNTAKMMIQLGIQRPLDSHYSSIPCPTKIVLGGLDNMSTDEESRSVAKQLPFGEFVSIPDLEHPIEKVNVPELSQIIESFLK